MKWIYLVILIIFGGILFLVFRKKTVTTVYQQIPPDGYILPQTVSPVIDNSGILGDAIKTGVGALLTSSAEVAAGAGIFATGGAAVAPAVEILTSAPIAGIAPAAVAETAGVIIPTGAGLGSLGILPTLGVVGLGLFALYEIGNITGAFDKDMTGRDKYGNFIQVGPPDLSDRQGIEADLVRGGDRG